MFKFNHSRFFYLIKCIRLKKTMDILDYKKFMGEVRMMMHKRLERICNDPLLSQDVIQNNTQIELMMAFKYGFRTVKIISFIVFSAYFLGLSFFIFSDIANEVEEEVLVLDEDFRESTFNYKY